MDIVLYILIGVLVVAMLAIFYYYDKAHHYKFWFNQYHRWNKEYLTDNTKKHLLIKAQKQRISIAMSRIASIQENMILGNVEAANQSLRESLLELNKAFELDTKK